MNALDSLTDEQKQTLLNYQTITGVEDLETAIHTLDENRWNMSAAVEQFYSAGHSSRVLNHGMDQVDNFEDKNQQFIDLQNNAPLLPTASSVAVALDEPQRLRNNVQRPTPTLTALFTTPFQWGFKFFWAILSYTLGLFQFLGLGVSGRRRTVGGSGMQRNRSSTERSTAECASVRFKEDFESQYGSKHPPFFVGTYTQALNTAKSEIRYALVILQSDEHDDTDKFSRETISSDTFISFVSEKNLLVWGGNIHDAEAFKVSAVLNATSYPFMALITLQGSRMAVAHRFEGLMSTGRIISKLRRLIDRFDPLLAGARADRASHAAARSIRQQQDDAYQASLLADQEKARKAKEEEEQAKKALLEQEQQRIAGLTKLERRKQLKIELAANMPVEPDVGEPNTTRLSIRLPSGERVIRRFKADDTIQILWNFIETHDLKPLDLETEFSIVCPFPRRVYRNMDMTMEQAGLVPSASVVVEEMFDDGL
ncbi:hypothetical protein BDV3_004045 [Batrachochytrium dendrobatidis]|nr:UBX domain-containing protein 10 [Batrachochytrium dendrobatidis]